MSDTNCKKNFLPSEIIISATSGETLAMRQVINHYQNYIASLSIRTQYKNGIVSAVYIDDFLRRSLESKLIEKVLKFDITR